MMYFEMNNHLDFCITLWAYKEWSWAVASRQGFRKKLKPFVWLQLLCQSRFHWCLFVLTSTSLHKVSDNCCFLGLACHSRMLRPDFGSITPLEKLGVLAEQTSGTIAPETGWGWREAEPRGSCVMNQTETESSKFTEGPCLKNYYSKRESKTP